MSGLLTSTVLGEGNPCQCAHSTRRKAKRAAARWWVWREQITQQGGSRECYAQHTESPAASFYMCAVEPNSFQQGHRQHSQPGTPCSLQDRHSRSGCACVEPEQSAPLDTKTPNPTKRLLCRLKVRNNVKRLLHRTLAAAFVAWTDFAASRHNLRASEQQVGRLPRQRILDSCWQLWWQQYTGRRRLRAATGRIMHGTAARVLQQWRVSQAAACVHAAWPLHACHMLYL